MKKIETLTKEQEELLITLRDKWLKIGLATGPVDLPAATKAIGKAYQAAGLEPPVEILHARSPIEAACIAAELEGNKRALSSYISHMIFGAHDAAWLGFYDAMKQIGVEGLEIVEGLSELAEVCGWWAPYKDVAIVQDRPEEIHMVDGLLHNENGPAILYSDGFAVYSIDGVRVPRFVVMETITLERILAEENAEIQLIMRQRYGEARYLHDIGAKPIDVDSTLTELWRPDGTVIFRALVEDGQGRRYLVAPDGSTKNRTFVMRVPDSVSTCVEAEKELTGIDPSLMIGRS